MATKIIAEVGNHHHGLASEAIAYVDALADVGIKYVKFQCHIARAESSDEEQFHVDDPNYGLTSRYDYWSHHELTRSTWQLIARRARTRGMKFGVSPFSLAAVEMCSGLVDFWKIPASLYRHEKALQAIGRFSEPVFVSMCLDPHFAWSKYIDPSRVCELHGVSQYPSEPQHVPIGRVSQTSGLSDHSGHGAPAVVAAAVGAPFVEVHVCWDRRQAGRDAKSAIPIFSLPGLLANVRYAGQLGDNLLSAGQLADMESQFLQGRLLDR